MNIIKEMYGLDLNDLIIQWASDKDLIKKENATKQYFKLIEEKGELFGSILKNNREEMIDAIGDLQVVKIILCKQLGIDYSNHIDKDSTFYNEVLMLLDLDKTLLIYNELIFRLLKIDNGNITALDRSALELSIQTLRRIAEIHDTSLEECLSSAYEEIKNRKGKTVNGSFIKD